jgi:hypothetical protein
VAAVLDRGAKVTGDRCCGQIMGRRPGGAPASPAGKAEQAPERLGVGGKRADKLSGRLKVDCVMAEPRPCAGCVGTDSLHDTVFELHCAVTSRRPML